MANVKETDYIVEAEILAKLERMASRLCGGSDKMRNEGNLLWVLIDDIKQLPLKEDN
jgi:hypothetical protein